MADSVSSTFSSIPARCLTFSSRQLLSQMLNPEQPLLTPSRLARDFRGLAELMGFNYNEIRNFQRDPDPTGRILDAWGSTGKNLEELVQMFEKMERFDVVDEVLPLLNDIATNYIREKDEKPLQVYEVSSCRSGSCTSSNLDVMTVEDIQRKSELTETGCCYDAYVCYADDDLDFVRVLATRLEGAGLKLYIRERDALIGVIEYDAMVRLITERCNYVLIVLSPEFVKSPQCEFQAKFVAGLAIEQRKRKLIPVIYKTCTIPTVIMYLTKLDFTKTEMHDWAWHRLIASLSCGNQNFTPQPSPATSFSSIPALPSPPISLRTRRTHEQETKPHKKFLSKFIPSMSSSASSGFISQGSSYEKIPQ